MNIFISSTYIDCINYRKAAVDAINSLQSEDLNVLGMELFGARKKTTLEVCLEEVSKADIYILIVAHRYGTIDESTQKSYTQLEYEKIVKKDIPILVYFLDESVPVMPCWVDKDFKYTKLSEFKSELGKRHTFQTFLDADDLRYKIVSDLSRELNLDYKSDVCLSSKDIDLTPDLYSNYEFVIEFIMISDYMRSERIRKADPQVVEKLRLIKGNTLETTISIIEDNKQIRNSFLLCQGKFAQWLKNSCLDKKNFLSVYDEYEYAYLFQAKVKLVYTSYKGLEFDCHKEFYIDTDYIGLLLLDMPKKIGEFYEKIPNLWEDWE